MSHRIQGYWDKSGTEIDLVALNETDKVIRFGSCKRSEAKLLSDLAGFDGHAARFLERFPEYQSWDVQRFFLSPKISPEIRAELGRRGRTAQDLDDLTAGL